MNLDLVDPEAENRWSIKHALLLTSALLTIALLTLIGAGCASKAEKDGLVPVDVSRVPTSVAPYDPDATPPSPGAAALRSLAELDPSVASFSADIEAAERAAIVEGQKLLLEKVRDAASADSDSTDRSDSSVHVDTDLLSAVDAPVPASTPLAALSKSRESSSRPNFPWLGVANAAGESGGVDVSLGTGQSASMVLGIIFGMGDTFIKDMPTGASVAASGSETKSGTKANFNVELGKKADGSSNFGMGIKTESQKDGKAAETDMTGSVSGLRCPDANGKIDFTAKVRLAAGSDGVIYARDITAKVLATVDDEADVMNSDYDLIQGTRQVKDGRSAYVETGYRYTAEGADVTKGKTSNMRVIRRSQQSTIADVQELASAGHDAALHVGITALVLAEQNWKNGGCVKIEAPSPGKVKPSSVTKIPVKVIHRFDGSSISSKLTAALAGEKSVAPTSLPSTPGELSYTAPDKKGKATISLTATSRRGIAQADLNASTGSGAYTASGRKDAVSFSGLVCDIEKPFELKIGSGARGTFKFVPGAGSSLSGKTSYSAAYALGRIYGSGKYTIKGDPASGKELTLVETGRGCATTPKGPVCANESERIKLTPADDSSCPK